MKSLVLYFSGILTVVKEIIVIVTMMMKMDGRGSARENKIEWKIQEMIKNLVFLLQNSSQDLTTSAYHQHHHIIVILLLMIEMITRFRADSFTTLGCDVSVKVFSDTSYMIISPNKNDAFFLIWSHLRRRCQRWT